MVTTDPIAARMSQEAFALKLIEQLRDAGDQRQACYDESQFRLLFSQDGRSTGYANLRNLYEEYCARELPDRGHFMKHATRSLLASHKTLPSDFDDARCDVLLTVRNRSYFSLIELANELRSITGSDKEVLRQASPRTERDSHGDIGRVTSDEVVDEPVSEDAEPGAHDTGKKDKKEENGHSATGKHANHHSASTNEPIAPLEFIWPYETLGEHLGIGLVYDLPEAMIMLQQGHLDDWNVSFYEAYETAMSNLMELPAEFAAIEDHTYVSATGDNYDASRLLLPELIHELTVKGLPIVMLPNRDRLLVTGSEDMSGLSTLLLLAQHALQQPRPMTGAAFSWIDGHLQPWLPSIDHPLHDEFKELALRTELMDYHEQRELLLALLAVRKQRQVEIAEFRIRQGGGTQPPFSYSVWTDGPETWLPKTDRICLVRHNQTLDHPLIEGVNTTWERAEQVLGEFEQVGDYYPPLYRLADFPTSRQLDRLR